MAEEKQEEKRVTLDDVVEVLAKHSPSPNDPDDAETLTRFNQQVTDDRQKKESGGDSDRKESPPQGSQPTGTQRGKRE